MVSIVTIVKNDKQHIEKTMRSVLTQKYLNFEYVIKDGLSTDGTSEIIKKMIEQYPKRKIIYVNVKDGGIYDAMNQAVTYCSGNWINFMNSGDEFYNTEVLEKIFDKDSEYKTYGVLYGDVVVSDIADRAIWAADISMIKRKMPFCHQSCFVRRELLIQFPFNINYKIAADYNNILDLYTNGIEFFFYNQIAACFDLMGVSSKRFADRYRERVSVLKNHKLYEGTKFTYAVGICYEHIKSIADHLIPDFAKGVVRDWYKYNIKQYKRIGK